MNARPAGRRSPRPGRQGPGSAAPRADGAPRDDLVYGRNPVREALAGRRRVHRLLVSDRTASLDFVRAASCPHEIVTPERLTELAGSEEHQGVVARVERYPYARADSLTATERPLIVVLDEVTDPHNLGAIARTAECAGATGLVLPEHRSASVTGAVCKASAGAVEHLSIARVRNVADWIESVKGPDLWVYAAELDGSTPYVQADLSGGIVLVVGAEGKGVRPRVRAACDGTLALPLAGRIGSLNVSVAAGVLLYEAVRQRSTS